MNRRIYFFVMLLILLMFLLSGCIGSIESCTRYGISIEIRDDETFFQKYEIDNSNVNRTDLAKDPLLINLLDETLINDSLTSKSIILNKSERDQSVTFLASLNLSRSSSVYSWLVLF